ncbi:MAG: hypothetical protein LBV12_08115, partial [Puniceicoccales bacterium]|nr:hypothetical protein [Puniceicoccales bacterium]
MKKALFTLLLTAGLSGFADAATVTLASGQWIQLNFAPASTTTTDADLAAGFNSFQTNNNTTNAITSSNTLINSAGDIISGVTMDAISGWNALGGSGAWNYTGQTLAGNANWTSQETTTFVWSNTKVDAKVALGGLDSSLTYN